MSFYIKTKKAITVLLCICLSGALLIAGVNFLFSEYLSKTDKVDANLLIVEGWLPQYAIEMAHKEFLENEYDLIITTGIQIPEHCLVFTNGYLIFNTNKWFEGLNTKTDHILEIDAMSELDKENRAHFNIFINDSMIKSFFADKKERKFSVSFKNTLSDVDSILIQFDNDEVNEYGDRNLFIRELIIDNKIHIPFQNNSEFVIGEPDGKMRFPNNYSSFAERAKNRLLSLGADSSLVLAVPGQRVRINRTLTSVLAFRDWIDTSGMKVKGINIISVGTHARRTWMTYEKTLNKKYEVGIISLPDYVHNSRKRKLLKTLRETLGLIYYWFLLLPY